LGAHRGLSGKCGGAERVAGGAADLTLLGAPCQDGIDVLPQHCVRS